MQGDVGSSKGLLAAAKGPSATAGDGGLRGGRFARPCYSLAVEGCEAPGHVPAGPAVAASGLSACACSG